MLTEEDIRAFRTQSLIVICTEDSPGYPDPLIYVITAPCDASAEEVEELVIQQRIDEIGEDFEAEVRETFHVHVAWPGYVSGREYVLDNRA